MMKFQTRFRRIRGFKVTVTHPAYDFGYNHLRTSTGNRSDSETTIPKLLSNSILDISRLAPTKSMQRKNRSYHKSGIE